MISPLNNKILKKWLSNSFHFIPCNNATIFTMGSEPFKEDDFDDFLRANGLEIFALNKDTNVLIVGHLDFDEEEIKQLLDWREGKDLRVYSQEMFLAHWTTGQDPFEDKEIVETFAENHTGLQFLKSCWVDWVSTNVLLGRGGDYTLDSPKIGVLKELGYTVGKTRGKSPRERHRILETLFSSNLYKILPLSYIKHCKTYHPNYLAEWGEPKSSERLAKMRDVISTLCKKQKGKSHDVAASDYEEDLKWLEKCYRTGRFKFKLADAFVGERLYPQVIR